MELLESKNKTLLTFIGNELMFKGIETFDVLNTLTGRGTIELCCNKEFKLANNIIHDLMKRDYTGLIAYNASLKFNLS